jgi:hypothetical protein
LNIQGNTKIPSFLETRDPVELNPVLILSKSAGKGKGAAQDYGGAEKVTGS